MQTYTIHDRTEETDCSYCGMPLYVGDKAVDNDIDVFCSKSCAAIKQSRVTVLTTDEERHAIRYQNASYRVEKIDYSDLYDAYHQIGAKK